MSLILLRLILSRLESLRRAVKPINHITMIASWLVGGLGSTSTPTSSLSCQQVISHWLSSIKLNLESCLLVWKDGKYSSDNLIGICSWWASSSSKVAAVPGPNYNSNLYPILQLLVFYCDLNENSRISRVQYKHTSIQIQVLG